MSSLSSTEERKYFEGSVDITSMSKLQVLSVGSAVSSNK